MTLYTHYYPWYYTDYKLCFLGREKYYRDSEVNEPRGLGRFPPSTQAYTGTYRDRGVRSRSRSRSPVYSSRLHMDESPNKMSVRSRISSRPDLRKQKLSPITFSHPQRATSHASGNKYGVYGKNRSSESNGKEHSFVTFCCQ